MRPSPSDTMGKNDQPPVIVYGAGRRALPFLAWVRRQGCDPVCVCDADAEKWGRDCGGLPVMRLADAVRNYPDFRVYITIAPPLKYEVCRELEQSGICPKEWILNYETEETVNCVSIDAGRWQRVNRGLPLILYGAGAMAPLVLESARENGLTPVCFCDANPKKWHTECGGGCRY